MSVRRGRRAEKNEEKVSQREAIITPLGRSEPPPNSRIQITFRETKYENLQFVRHWRRK